jgi:putative phosphoesterase
MLLGILSDSHGHAETTHRAVEALLEAGAETLIHLGDIGSEEVLEELVVVPAKIVFGNCDDERLLARHAERLGVEVCHPIGFLEHASKRIAFSHGHLVPLMEAAVRNAVDYLLHGHTHEVRDERIGSTRVINPGALHRASRYTVALLDPQADRLRVLEVPR